MTEDPSNNAINNYKGVMLCSRPNEKRANTFEKPFCGRVVPGQQLGINPVEPQHPGEHPPQHRQPKILGKHKKWLNQFKEHVQQTKVGLEEKDKQDQERFKRIREQGEVDRERAKKMKEEYQQASTQVLNVLDERGPPAASGELNLENLRRLDAEVQTNKKEVKKGEEFKKKNERPLWAMTKEAVEDTEDKEVEDLLDFFEQNQVASFSQDEEIKDLLNNLKGKIEKMKEEDNWKEKEGDRMRQDRQARADDHDEDKYSQFSAGNSEGRSVASQKTQKKMEELRSKQREAKDWDKHTTSEKTSMANIEDRIAKNLADEVLRNYPNMKGVHSNTSIRKLLQAEAAKVMNQPIVRPVIVTLVREKQPINANTLPYLHRNPAI